MSKRSRKRHFVDFQVQGTLVLRAVLYWFFYMLTIATVLVCYRILTGPLMLFHEYFIELWDQFGVAAVISLLMLPLVVFDIVRMSNRFVGPIYRLRRKMKEANQGQAVPPIRFRDDDFWHELADEFNTLSATLLRNRSENDEVSEPPVEPNYS